MNAEETSQEKENPSTEGPSEDAQVFLCMNLKMNVCCGTSIGPRWKN
jgi:hypothetical protein